MEERDRDEKTLETTSSSEGSSTDQKKEEVILSDTLKAPDITQTEPGFHVLLGSLTDQKNEEVILSDTLKAPDMTQTEPGFHVQKGNDGLGHEELKSEKQDNGSSELETENGGLDSPDLKVTDKDADEVLAEEKETEPIFDGTETSELEATKNLSNMPMDVESEAQAYAWPEKAVALKNFVKEKGADAVSRVFRRLSGKKDEDWSPDEEENDGTLIKGDNENIEASAEVTQKSEERSAWNPLSFIKIRRDADSQINPVPTEHSTTAISPQQSTMKGRIIVFTRLGCQDCKSVRSLLHQKRLKYIEINIDIFPSRKLELEKNTGSSVVPKVYFNDYLVGGLDDLKAMDESGKLDEKAKDIMTEELSPVAPLPPLSGEDDGSGSGKIDELVTIVRKMKEVITPKDRFYKMRRFSNCFLGSEAVDFLSEDQYLEREEAVEFARKLASRHFFQHVLNENIFEDGNHLYRFLEHDPIVMTQCFNIPRGITDVEPKPITEIASRLRLLSYAIFEAYVSNDGRHVDYTSIYHCEEFRRYLRTIEELQRVELDAVSREEKLAFFLNLYNMMTIHAVLAWGYPAGPLDRRKFFGDFKYVIGGSTYSLSAIHNGILRGNQRPPYNITKPFGVKDKRSKVALPYVEPLVHFALVYGTRSGPALRCYSPGNIDKELMEAARDFLRNGGLILDAEAKVVSISKILLWYNVDFGKNETEVIKHAANYLEPAKSEELLELLATTQLKVVYQSYDWSPNW